MKTIKDFLGIGVSFPVEVDTQTKRFKLVSYEEDIKQAIYIILMTGQGERVMQGDFGCNISQYIFEINNPTYMNLLKIEIVAALTKWEPRIEEIDVSIDSSKMAEGQVIFSLAYKISATQRSDNFVFPYYLEGEEGMH